MKPILCLLIFLAGTVCAQAESDFMRDVEASQQKSELDSLRRRIDQLEFEKQAENRRWQNRADAALNAAWDRTSREIIRRYPDFLNSNSAMSKRYRSILKNLRVTQNPILFDPSAPRLIANQAAQELYIPPLR